MTLPQLVEEARKVEWADFSQLVEAVSRLLAKENDHVGNFDIVGRLVMMKNTGKAVIASDLHGDLRSLTQILEETRLLEKLKQDDKTFLILLGDYGDRGAYSVEVYHILMNLKLLFPQQVILMRGNHEGPEDLLAYPHDLPAQFQARFGEQWRDVYSKIFELFKHLYNAVIVEERYLMIHGGLPLEASTLEDLAFAHIRHPEQRMLEDMLWSDPSEDIEETVRSPRGAGKLFGEKVTDQALKRYSVKILLRGHEPSRDGFKIDHGGKILTLFSRNGPPYFNVHGAYLHVDLSQKIENAEQLIPHIHRF